MQLANYMELFYGNHYRTYSTPDNNIYILKKPQTITSIYKKTPDNKIYI